MLRQDSHRTTKDVCNTQDGLGLGADSRARPGVAQRGFMASGGYLLAIPLVPTQQDSLLHSVAKSSTLVCCRGPILVHSEP